MTLPSKEECLTKLQEGKGTLDTEHACPICLESRPDVLTPCQHQYCLECLSFWLAKSNTCPICRGELYEAGDDEPDDEEFNDDEIDDQDMDDEMSVYDSIDRLDLDFNVDEDEVTAAVISLRHQDLERSIARSQPVHVNYHALLARSVAGVLHLNPEVEDGFTLDDLNRSVWTYVLDIIQHTLSRLQNQTLTCGELWDTLDKDIHVTFEGSATLRYADGPDGEHEFQQDLFDLLNYITHEAHNCYSTHHRGAHNVHPLRQLPGHFTPLRLPPWRYPFETSEADIADNLAHIAEQDLSNLNLHDQKDRLLYISFAQLYPAMLGAVYTIKPNVPPTSEDVSDSRHDFLYPQWRSLLHNVSDTLFNLHGRKLTAEQFWKRLDDCTTEHRGYRYLCPRGRGDSFDEDISSVLRSVVLSAMRLNGVESLPAGTVDTDMAGTGSSE